MKDKCPIEVQVSETADTDLTRTPVSDLTYEQENKVIKVFIISLITAIVLVIAIISIAIITNTVIANAYDKYESISAQSLERMSRFDLSLIDDTDAAYENWENLKETGETVVNVSIIAGIVIAIISGIIVKIAMPYYSDLNAIRIIRARKMLKKQQQ